MYYSFWEEAVFVVIGRNLNLSVSQGADESGLPAVWYEVVSQRDCHKIICDEQSSVYASLL